MHLLEADVIIPQNLELFFSFCNKFGYHTENKHNQNMVDLWCYILTFDVKGLRICFSQINSQIIFQEPHKIPNFHLIF